MKYLHPSSPSFPATKRNNSLLVSLTLILSSTPSYLTPTPLLL